MAEVSITGNLNQGLTTDDLSGGTTTSRVQGMHGISGDNFITFSGNEALDNGMKANFKLEQALDLNGTVSTTSLFGANTTGNSIREAWVGVSGDFGSISVGNQYAPLFLATIAAAPLGANNIKGAIGNLGLTAVLGGNSIVYNSPSLSGFNFSLMQNYGGKDTSGGDNAGNAYGYSVSYSNGPLALAYGRHETTNSGGVTANGATLVDLGSGALVGNSLGANATTAGSSNAIKNSTIADGDTTTGQGVSISYDLGVVKVGYWATRADFTNGDKIQGQSGAISAPFGALTLGYTFGTGSATGNSVTSDYTGYQYTAKYALSKRTYVYLEGGQLKDTTNDETRQTYGFGINHSF